MRAVTTIPYVSILASIEFGDFAQITNWQIFSLANRLMMWIGEHLIWWCVLQPRERMKTFESEQTVHGHHVYKAVWMPFIGEELIFLPGKWQCKRFVCRGSTEASFLSELFTHGCRPRATKNLSSMQRFFGVWGHNSLHYNWTKAVLDGFKAGWLRCSLQVHFYWWKSTSIKCGKACQAFFNA